MQDTPEASDIRRRMDEVRFDLDEDVQEFVEDVRGMSSWRYYVRNYPWACVGAALVAGYLLVPRRRNSVPLTTQMAENLPEANCQSAPTSGARGVLLNSLANLAMRGIATYVERQADQLFASPPAKSSERNPS